jgi:fatty acid desaturase
MAADTSNRYTPTHWDAPAGPRPGDPVLPRNVRNGIIAGGTIVGITILATITGVWWLLPVGLLVLGVVAYGVAEVVQRADLASEPVRPEPRREAKRSRQHIPSRA